MNFNKYAKAPLFITDEVKLPSSEMIDYCWPKHIILSKIDYTKVTDQILFEKKMTSPNYESYDCGIPGCTICTIENKKNFNHSFEENKKELTKEFEAQSTFVPKFPNSTIVKAIKDSNYVTAGSIYSIECSEIYAGLRSVLIYSDDAHRTRWYSEDIFELFGTHNTALKAGDLIECSLTDVFVENLEPGIIYQASSDSYWNGDRYNCLEFVKIVQDEHLNTDSIINAKYFKKIDSIPEL